MSSGSGENHLARNPVSTVPPEIPRRPSITMARPARSGLASVSATSTNGNADNIPPSSVPGPPMVRHERIREIHKNAWLKRLYTSHDKKGTPLVKRAEKWWVVFCVHDDLEAYLEFYTEPKMAQIHKPTTRINLTTCLHISPSIVGQDNEFQFAVTLLSQVIYLSAADWDQMLEWVESLQGKLREMNILSPKDNLYSKLPEVRNCVATLGLGAISTRDPNSPLPPPPSNNGFVTPEFPTGYINMNTAMPSLPEGRCSLPMTLNDNVVHSPEIMATSTSASASVYIQPSGSGNSVLFPRDESSDNAIGNGVSIIKIDPSVQISQIVPSYQNNTTSDIQSSEPNMSSGTNTNATMVHVGFDCYKESSADATISQALNLFTPSPVVTTISHPSSSQKSLRRPKSQSNSRKSSSDVGINCQTLVLTLPSSTASTIITQSSAPVTNSELAGSNESFYEHIFAAATSNTSVKNCQSINDQVPSVPEKSKAGKTERLLPEPSTGSSHVVICAPRTQITVESNRFERNCHNRPHGLAESSCSLLEQSTIRSSSNSEFTSAITSTPNMRPLQNMISRGGCVTSRAGVETRSPKSQHPSTNASLPGSTKDEKPAATTAHVPLKESQVIHLNHQINHPSGVQILIKKKDCLDTIAFIDYLGAVWISGWKQQEHPVLYYAFHVGDQVISVSGQKIQSSEEARKVIRMATTNQVEFVIKRLPHGKVFVLKRKTEGEPLGLVAVGNCSEISEVVPNSLAAIAGLSPKAISVDGQSTCNWVLTEINNRPLSLVARESEVRDRLNAVGKEISILVQPSDLVKHMKKQLKAIKGFKEYLVV